MKRARAARKAKRDAEDLLLPLDGVEGVAIGETDGEPHIKVFVDTGGRVDTTRIPNAFDKVPVVIEETGVFDAY